MEITIKKGDASITFKEDRILTEYYQSINGVENVKRVTDIIQKMFDGIIAINIDKIKN
jgi:uncharacterized SAM-binding protein YcdF (DUF218 family)